MLQTPSKTEQLKGESSRDSSETVPGDVKLAAGDKIPADCRIIETTRITVDEASLAGESEAVEKMETTVASNTVLAEQVSMVYAGTTVVSGACKEVVVHTGMHTEFGNIQSSLDAAAPQETPLAMLLVTFGNQLSAAIGMICIFVWLTNLVRFDDPSIALKLPWSWIGCHPGRFASWDSVGASGTFP